MKLKYSALYLAMVSLLMFACTDEPSPAPKKQNDAATISFEANHYTFDESAGEQSLTVSRRGGSSGEIVVDIDIVAGSATEQSDYVLHTRQLIWSDQDSADKTISLTIANNTQNTEIEESFALQLLIASGNAELGSIDRATITIGDQVDAPGTVHFSPTDYTFSESSTQQHINVTRFGGGEGTVEVEVSLVGGTATPGVDFVFEPMTLSWADGDRSLKTVPITIVDDKPLNEGIETVLLQLTLVSGTSTIETSTATINIQDSIIGSTIQFTGPVFNTSEDSGDGGGVVTVSRLNGVAGAVSVNYTISNGTASSGIDYRAASGTLSWVDGSDEAKNIFVDILSDSDTNEGIENVIVTLSDISGANLGSITTASLQIYDIDTLPIPADSYFFYNSFDRASNSYNGIYAVNANDPQNLVPETITNEKLNFALKIDKPYTSQSRFTANQFAIHAIVYSTGTSIWRVDGDISNGPLGSSSPVQVSSEASINSACYTRARYFRNGSNPDNSLIIYSNGTACDQWRMVQVGWDNSKAPITALKPVIELLDSNEEVTGFLAMDQNDLVKCPLDFSNCSLILSQAGSVGAIRVLNGALLTIGKSLYWFDEAGISQPIASFNSNARYDSTDGVFQFIVLDNTLYRFKLETNSTIESLVTEANPILFVASVMPSTSTKVVYSTSNSVTGAYELKAIAKDGSDNGVAQTLFTSSGQIVPFDIRDSRIYYHIFNGSSSTNVSGMIMDDGTFNQQEVGSQWVGLSANKASRLSNSFNEYIIRQLPGGAIRAYKSASYTVSHELGNIDANHSSLTYRGVGSSGFALVQGSDSIRDLYYIDLNGGGLLKNFTTTPLLSEFFIY